MRIVLKVSPSFEHGIFLQLDQDDNDKYWLSGNKGERFSVEKIKIQLETHKVEAALRDLAEVSVPAVPEAAFGLDRTTYELEIHSGFNSVRYAWGCNPPEGYEAIALFAQKLIDWAEIEEHH